MAGNLTAHEEYWFDEHAWLFASHIPPILMTVLMLYLARRVPGVLRSVLEWTSPDLKLEHDADPKSETMIFSRGKNQYNKGGVQPKRSDEGSIQGIRVYTAHVLYIFALPAYFCAVYLWNAAFVEKYATAYFPLAHCQNEFRCFYISQHYEMFAWPTYQDLGCAEMRRRSYEDGGYFFRTPPEAKFFKCYAWVFTLRHFVGVIGDVTGLAVFFALFIGYFIFTLEPMPMEEKEAKEKQMQEWEKMVKKNCCYCISCVMMFFVVMAGSIWTYGSRIHSQEGFILAPASLCLLYGLLTVKRRALRDVLNDFKQLYDDDDSTGPCLPCTCLDTHSSDGSD